jgi:hypothetical protein
MLHPVPHTRYHITAILAAHRTWTRFVAQYKRWVSPTKLRKNLKELLLWRRGTQIYE